MDNALIVADLGFWVWIYGGGVPEGMAGQATVPGLLAARVRRDGARPLVTFLDAASGERMELSAVSVANAVAKAAGLLRDDLDAEPGDTIAVHLPLHWQAAVWWGACAAVAGVCAPGVDAAPIGIATTTTLAAIGDCRERVAVSLAPFGLPDGATLPAGVIEAAIAARAHPDEFIPWSPIDPLAPLMRCGDQALTTEQCLDRAVDLARDRGLASGGRLLVTDADWIVDPGIDAGRIDAGRTDDSGDCLDSWLALLAVPLIAQASVVIATNTDRDEQSGDPSASPDAAASLASIIDAERITARMRS